MVDFHHNIFYYYRGSNQSKDNTDDRQLEDNTTKALINTLKHCSPDVALKFLNWLGITTTGKVEVELQKATIGTAKIRRTSQRLLLGLIATEPKNHGNSICSNLQGSASGDSRPDAWLYGEDFVVLIESKVGNALLDLKQMRCHFRKLQTSGRQASNCQVRTWAEVHQFFVMLLSALKAKNKWLVQQSTQYLEWRGMSEFTGFEEGVFQFFAQDKRDKDTQKWIRDTMDFFAKKVLDALKALQVPPAVSFYSEYHVGNFNTGDDHFWVAFGPQAYAKVCHQIIALDNNGLKVVVKVELKEAANKLKNKIRSNQSGFRKIISDLPGPFSVRIVERRKRQASSYDYYTIAKLEAGIRGPASYGLNDPKSDGFPYIETLLKQIELPCFWVTREINRKKVLELSKGNGDALVDEAVGIMKKFHPVVEFINL